MLYLLLIRDIFPTLPTLNSTPGYAPGRAVWVSVVVSGCLSWSVCRLLYCYLCFVSYSTDAAPIIVNEFVDNYIPSAMPAMTVFGDPPCTATTRWRLKPRGRPLTTVGRRRHRRHLRRSRRNRRHRRHPYQPRRPLQPSYIWLHRRRWCGLTHQPRGRKGVDIN